MPDSRRRAHRHRVRRRYGSRLGPRGKRQIVLRAHKGILHSARFSPDGRRIITASTDGTVRVWPVDREELLRLVEARLYRDLTSDERKGVRCHRVTTPRMRMMMASSIL